MSQAKIVRERVQGIDLTSRFPRSQFDRASLGRAGQTSPIHECPTLQLTGLKRSVANVLVPETTGHLQRSCGVYALMSELFWQYNGNLHTIRHVLLMLLLICILRTQSIKSLILSFSYSHLNIATTQSEHGAPLICK